MENNTVSVSNCPTCNHFPTQFIQKDDKGNLAYRALKLDDSSRNFMRGLITALLLSIPLWAIVAAVVYLAKK